MKYFFFCIAVAVLLFGPGFLVARLIRKIRKAPMKKGTTLLIVIGTGILLQIVTMLVYMGIYHHADERAQAALLGSDTVAVSGTEGGFFFDGPGTQTALVFYPGAKVEAKAYAPLMLALADEGIDCFLADMPFNFAFFGSNAADRFIQAFSYDSWILAGHSLGGVVASDYASRHTDTVSGLVLLAAYPLGHVSDLRKLCSVFGTRDGCLNLDEYRARVSWWPQNSAEYIIEGGNHAQFGNYGPQSGDGTAGISAEEQQRQTVEAIAACFLSEN